MRGKASRNASPTSRVNAKSAVGVAAEVMVEEDAAGAARLVAVRQEEVAVAPGLELRIVAGVVAVAGGLERGMEIGRVLHRFRCLGPHRRQVAAAAEPALGGDQHPRVEVRRRHARALHVRDQADAARPEPRILLGAGDLARNSGLNSPHDGGDVHPHLLEHPPAHHAHYAATPIEPSAVGRRHAVRTKRPAGCSAQARPAHPRSPRIRRKAGRAATRTIPVLPVSARDVAAWRPRRQNSLRATQLTSRTFIAI